jgi:hypothetical protein
MLGGFLLIVGLAVAGIGALMIFAGGMSDDPAGGDKATSQGCIVLVVGLAAFIGGAALLSYHVLR